MKIRQFLSSNWQIISIAALTLFIHLWNLDYHMTFGGEAAYDLINVAKIVGGKLILLGPRHGPYNNISTVYLGPFYYYLLSPFMWIFKLDPIGSAWASVVARVLTTILAYVLSKKAF